MSNVIQRGARVRVRTAFGDTLEKRAVSGIEFGDRFPCVRVATEEEWLTAEAEGREPRSDAWPVDAVWIPHD